MPAVIGRPDIVFPRERLAIFCDGDFYHGKDWAKLRQKLMRRANPSYWVQKIDYNRRRDREVNAALEEVGWRVLRFWESDIKRDVEQIVAHVEAVLERE